MLVWPRISFRFFRNSLWKSLNKFFCQLNIFFLSSHETFPNIDHILGHETHLSKFKRRITQNLLSDHSEVWFSSVAQSCPTLCDPMNRSTPGLPVHHQFLKFTQTHVHRVSDAIQPSHPPSSPSPSEQRRLV